MNDCPACAGVRQKRTSGLFVECEGCYARQLARSPAFVDAARVGTMTPEYRAALERLFPGREAEGHAAAKGWA